MKTAPRLLLPLFALLLASCSSFERDWNQSVADYRSGKVASPAGPWTGTWTTKTNGHTGALRAIVTPSSGPAGEYDFRYHATWAKIFSGAYTVTYPAKKSGGVTRVDGEEKLGLFGTFGHRATITGSGFDATYSSDKGDLGTFQMRRPE